MVTQFERRLGGCQNIPPFGPALLIANHVSVGDAALVQAATARTVYFPALAHTLDLLRSGELVCIFPEGAPARTGTVESFTREIDPLLRACRDIPVLPLYLLQHSHNQLETLYAGKPLPQAADLNAAAVRTAVLELGCEACELATTGASTLAHRLVAQCRGHWSNPAIADSSGGRYRFGELLTDAILVRNWIAQRDPQPNLGVYLPSSTTAAIVNYGITLAARAAVNLNFTSGEANCRAAVEKCELRTVLTSRAFLEKTKLPQWPEMVMLEDVFQTFSPEQRRAAAAIARDAPFESLTADIRPGNTACILFSGGSTGVPKGIELTHWNVLENADGCEAFFPVTPAECMLGVLPFFHSFGYTFALWFPVLEGFRAVYHSNPTDARVIGELAAAESPTFLLSAPTFALQYARKIEAGQFRTLKYVLVGAEKLRDTVAGEFRQRFGFDLLAGYGCTELGPGVAINRPDIDDGPARHIGSRAGSVGRPLRGIAIRIVHPETGTSLPNGQEGMILVKGPSRMPGYYRAPELTATALRDGYYVTGDLGHIDDDGFLYVTDRLARFSKIGGEMVPHLKIEEAVGELAQAFVTGVPDDRRGERLVLLFVSETATPGELYARISTAGLPALWVPKRDCIFRVDAIPLLANGKVDLQRARALAAQRLI